ncbi:MAG TPA: nitrile hydratase subunit beta [Usitatibacter sp.]|nr:nitrile hydratase subunit beta [Usitatibacter sp.]
MNGVHDMGGLQDFGPVVPEPDEPAFHAPWEKRAMAMTLAMGATGAWSLDQARSARESLPPATYLSSSYYRIWLTALENLMVERNLVTREELQDGRMRTAALKLDRVLAAADVPTALAKGTPTQRHAQGHPRFAVGQSVHTCNWNPPTHTRLPRYCRDKRGTIMKVHGFHVYADASAEGRADAHWLYSVRFEAAELWGRHTTANAVYVDCWEPYLEPA